MTLELLYRFQQEIPFQPFHLFLADGRALPVTSAELIMLADDGSSVSVFVPPGIQHLIDPTLVVSVQFGSEAPSVSSP